MERNMKESTLDPKTALKALNLILGVVALAGLTPGYAGTCVSESSSPFTLSADSSNAYELTATGGIATVNTGVTVTTDSTTANTAPCQGAIFYNPQSLGAFTNNGSIYATPTSGSEISVFNAWGSIASLNNNGILSNSGPAATLFIYDGTTDSLNNASGASISNTSAEGNDGAIEVAGSGWGGSGTITTLNNAGTISSVSGSAILNLYGGIITTLINSGEMQNSGSLAGYAAYGTIYNDINNSAINTITNTGSIYTSISGAYGIYNSTSGAQSSTNGILTINNSQGAGNVNGPLTYTGSLPATYNVIINSTTIYGQFLVSGSSGSMAFGISNLSASPLAGGTYVGVLQGFPTLSNVTTTTGTFNGYPWSLVADSVVAGQWNLVYDAPPTITSLNPATGISTGGTSVVIAGTGFAGATSVTFGGTAASSYVVNSQEQITATAPPHATGTVDVQVVTPNGTATTANAFTYSQATINGLCGTANGVYYTTAPSTSDLCLAGTASTVTQSAPLYTWSCAGLGGGTTANCSTSKATQATLTISSNPKIIKSGRGAILSAKGGSGTGKVRYSVVASGGASCSIKSFSGKTQMKSGTRRGGICTVSATKAGDNTYNATTASPLPITVK
jgi:hypothetical protein